MGVTEELLAVLEDKLVETDAPEEGDIDKTPVTRCEGILEERPEGTDATGQATTGVAAEDTDVQMKGCVSKEIEGTGG